jgi:hypothetical protein
MLSNSVEHQPSHKHQNDETDEQKEIRLAKLRQQLCYSVCDLQPIVTSQQTQREALTPPPLLQGEAIYERASIIAIFITIQSGGFPGDLFLTNYQLIFKSRDNRLVKFFLFFFFSFFKIKLIL